jgi:hypothetical protein
MAKTLDSDGLLASVKRRAMFPATQETFTDEDLLEIATEEMCISIVPKILQLHEDHYVADMRIDLVASQSNYAIPYRSIGNKFQDIFYVDTSGTLYETTKISSEDIASLDSSTTINGPAVTYYVQGNEVVFLPHIGATPTGSIVFKYYLSPNELVESERSAKITAIDTVTGIITVDGIPDHFDASMLVDFIMARSPFKIYSFDNTIASIDSTNKTITFATTDIPRFLVVGDYIMKAGETVVPQLPVELHALLAQRVAIACLEGQTDTEALKNARIRLREMEDALGVIIDNRSEGSPTKAVNQSSFFSFRR